MAGIAGAYYLGVINNEDGRPDIRGMTILANIACLYVRLDLARGIVAIVTTHTIAGDIYMVKIRG